MSYKYRVLSDAPVGYWRLNEYVLSTYDDADITYDEPGYEYDQVLSDRLYDETSIANQGFVSGGSSAIFSDILPLTTFTSPEMEIAGCKVTDNTILKIKNRPNKYKMFYSGTENLAFGIEFWLSFDDAPVLQNNILTVQIPGFTSAQIYALNDKIYFTVNSASQSYTAYKQVYRWDSQMHVLVSFSDRKIQVSINAISGEAVSVPQSFVFDLDNTSSMDVDYQIGPAAINNHFIINDLAFYNYVLSENLIKNHMVWAANDSKPQAYVKETSGYFFDIQDSPMMFDFQKQFSKERDYQDGISTNLISDGTGLTIDKTLTSGSQIGTWVYQIPTSSYSKIYGIKVSWDSGLPNNSAANNYAILDISYDNGDSWHNIQNGSPIAQFDDSLLTIYPNILIRVTISSSNTSVKNQPRIDNLFIGIYKDMSIFSDFGAYSLAPKEGSYIGDTFAIKDNMFNIMARSKNFGIKLSEVYNPNSNSFKNPIASITPQNQSTGYQSLEFWFRYDEDGVGFNQYILDTIGQDASIYLIQNEGLVYQTGFSAIYVNGIDITNANRVLTKGELYHFVCVFPAFLNAELYLGGNKDLNGFCRATYGFISLYPNAFSSLDAQNRYLSYLTSSTENVGLGENYLTSIAEFSGGSTTFNAGNPILAYATPPNT